MRLVGHLGGTSFVFVCMITFAWFVAWTFAYLQSVREFPDAMFELITRMEIGLVYLDAAVCVFVLLCGVVRYLRDVVNH